MEEWALAYKACLDYKGLVFREEAVCIQHVCEWSQRYLFCWKLTDVFAATGYIIYSLFNLICFLSTEWFSTIDKLSTEENYFLFLKFFFANLSTIIKCCENLLKTKFNWSCQNLKNFDVPALLTKVLQTLQLYIFCSMNF